MTDVREQIVERLAGLAAAIDERTGEYDDRWVRTHDGWRLTSRSFDMRATSGDFAVLQASRKAAPRSMRRRGRTERGVLVRSGHSSSYPGARLDQGAVRSS